MDSKSHNSVFVGYAPNGYRLWDMNVQKIFIARDVKFDETVFPFKHEECKESSNQELRITRRHEQEGDDNDDVVVPDEEGHNTESSVSKTFSCDKDQAESCRENEAMSDSFEDAVNDDDNAVALPSHNDSDSPAEITLRHSERERRRPRKFIDFFTGYRATSAACISTDYPEAYSEIANRSDADKWMEAVKDELKSMDKNKVWDIIYPPKGRKLLRTKWVFRVKDDENGVPKRYKARLVVKGFLQKEGIDYSETYAPVAKLTTIRVVLAVGLHEHLLFHQLDVKTAFLHGDLDEELYMAIPEGVEVKPGKACKLRKSIYGLKQAPRCWNQKFNKCLLELGFIRSNHDYCLYTKFSDNCYLIIIMYVDDLLIAGKEISSITWLKNILSEKFEMSDCGELKYFLGIKIENFSDYIELSQEVSIDKILIKFGMFDCNPVRSPMEKGLQLL